MTVDSTILATGLAIFSSAMGTVFVLIFKSISKADKKMEKIDTRLEHLEESDKTKDRKIEDISNRQDQKFEKLTEILMGVKGDISDLRVELQNKANR